MANTSSIDLGQISHELGLPEDKVRRAYELLEDGNTVPFITRFRKDVTGGLDEEQVWGIEQLATKSRLLAERKRTILKSIESQGKLSDDLAEQINAARSTKRLEDLYLPHKPKKQTLATIARQRGLEPLAREILETAPVASDLDARAADFVSADRGVNSIAEVLLGVGHLLAERVSERGEVRPKLRRILRRTGQLISTRIETSGSEQEKKRQTVATPKPPRAVTDDTQTPDPSARVASPMDVGLEQAGGDRSQKTRRKRQKLENAFKDYFDFRESLSHIPPHRVLAINRGERAKVLRVKIEGDVEAMHHQAVKTLVAEDHPHAEFLRECVRDALTRLILPSLEREIRRELTEWAEEHAVGVFVRNLRKLLLQPPVRGRRLLAIDPGFRSGCKLAALDAFGNVLEHRIIHVVGGAEKLAQGRGELVEMVRRHGLSVVAIGNGTACRETEKLVADAIANELEDRSVAYAIVNEAGASVYSTSALGREELPDYDADTRSAISIGRRLLDPLSELVKINPANIGVGMYQHDMKAKHLRQSLDAVVESCVNFVGVDVNTASPALLSYVSGLNQLTARRLYEYRREHGPFRNCEQLKNVSGIGEATFIQAAGFLRITDGDNPLDATWIHPESYDVARRVLARLDSSVKELAGIVAIECRRPEPNGTKTESVPAMSEAAETTRGEPPKPLAVPAIVGQSLAQRAAQADVGLLSRELTIGELLLKDILNAFMKLGRDPRDDLPPPVFRTGIMKLEDLKPGMELWGTVLNVVDFGAFVDIGISDSALVHISHLADRYIRDPHDVVSVGDVLKLWVLDVDKERRRVSLSAIEPGSEPRVHVRREKTTDSRKEGRSKKEQAQAPARPAPGDQGARRRRQPQGASRRKLRDGAREKRKSKPVTPITEAMVEGKEPMRSFSDLLQYYEKKNVPENGGPSAND